jgi:hypothetical protein
MKTCLFSLFFLGLFASCSSKSTTIVPREELQPSSNPNIEQVELTGGELIVFNSDRGWYDATHGYIEGVDMLGSRDTIPLSQVKLAQVSVIHSNPALDVLVAFLAVGVIAGLVLIVYFYTLFSRGGGCLVLLAVLSTGMLATVALFIR